MVISPTIANSALPSSIGAVNRLANRSFAMPFVQAATVHSTVLNDKSAVDISLLGKFLSLGDALPTITPSNPTAATLNSSNISDAAQQFIDAINALQGTLANGLLNLQSTLLGNSSDTTAAGLVQTQINLLLASHSGMTTALAKIGVTFQQGTIESGNFGQASLDLTTLQAALKSDPAGTAALLGQAIQVTGQLATLLSGISNTDTGSGQLGGNFDASIYGDISAALPFLLQTTSGTGNTVSLKNVWLDAALSGNLSPNLASLTNTNPMASPLAEKEPVIATGTPSTTALNSNVVAPTTNAALAAPTAPAMLNANPVTGANTQTAITQNVTSDVQSSALSTAQVDIFAHAVAQETAAGVAAFYLSNGIYGPIGGTVGHWPDARRDTLVNPIRPVVRTTSVRAI